MKINQDLIQFYTDELAETLKRKNRDYGNSVQEQFEEYGLASILMRLDDKMRRLKTLRNLTPQVREESLKDTLKDLSGYALLGLMCLVLEEQPKQEEKPVVKTDKIFKPSINVAPNPNKVALPWSLPAGDWIKNQQMFEKAVQKPPYFDQDDQH